MIRRAQRSSWVFAGFLAASLLLHPAGGYLYDRLRGHPDPILYVGVEGGGQARVHSEPAGIDCDQECRKSFPARTRVTLHAEPIDASVFEGWSGTCLEDDDGETDDVLQCTVELRDSLRIVAVLSPPLRDEDMVVDEVAMADDPQIEVPDPAKEATRLIDAAKLPPVPTPPMPRTSQAAPPPPPPAPPPVTPPPVEGVPPPMPVPAIKPEAPPPPPPPPQVAQAKPLTQQKAVEVDDDKSVVEEPPPDAAYASDKNRRVAQETRATETNLERSSKGHGQASEKSDVDSTEVGGAEDKVAQMETSEATSMDAERNEETSHSGDSQRARGVRAGEMGEGGKNGQRGEGGQGGDAPKGALSMRNIEGRGTPGGPSGTDEDDGLPAGAPDDDRRSGRRGRAGERGKRGAPGAPQVIAYNDYEAYERIIGKDHVQEEVEVARRTTSHKKGRFERKLDAINSSLENFTPEVRPGNQTALNTRAEPFALYIARMHRRIHELWGFGFLEDLDGKSESNPLNDKSLWVNIEIVLNPDGTIDKATVVRPSGLTTFDVAALDTVFTASPYDPPPKEILSADGKVYLHWPFHRDERQCTTFFVEKYILTTPPKNGDRGANLMGDPRRAGGGGGGGGGGTGAGTPGASEGDAAAAARASANQPTPDDPAAEKTALAWIAAFTAGNVAGMTATSGVPFGSGEAVLANELGGVGAVYQNVLSETRDRKVREWKILSSAGYRKLFGHLPPGTDEETNVLFLVVRFGREQLTLFLRQGAGGGYQVVGISR